MGRIGNFLQWRTVEGRPIEAGNTTIRPISQSLVLRLPNGGFVWSRPAAIRVESEEGEDRIAIVDVTRMIQLGFVLSSLGLLIVTWLVGRVQHRT